MKKSPNKSEREGKTDHLHTRRKVIFGTLTAAGTIPFIPKIISTINHLTRDWEKLENPKIPWTISQTSPAPETDPDTDAKIQSYLEKVQPIYDSDKSQTTQANRYMNLKFQLFDIIGSNPEKYHHARSFDVYKKPFTPSSKVPSPIERSLSMKLRAIMNRGPIAMVLKKGEKCEIQLGEHRIPLEIVTPMRAQPDNTFEPYTFSGMFSSESNKIFINSDRLKFNESNNQFTTTPETVFEPNFVIANEIAHWIFDNTLDYEENTEEIQIQSELFSDYYSTFFVPAHLGYKYLMKRLHEYKCGAIRPQYKLIGETLEKVLRKSKKIQKYEGQDITDLIKARDTKATEAYIEFLKNFRTEAETIIPDEVIQAGKLYIKK